MAEWKREAGHLWRSVVVIFGPASKVARIAMTVLALLGVGASAAVGFALRSLPWALVILLAVAFLLAFVAVWRRERHEADVRPQVISALVEYGDALLRKMELASVISRMVGTLDGDDARWAVEQSTQIFNDTRSDMRAWRATAKEQVGDYLGQHEVTLLITHPGVGPTRQRPGDLPTWDEGLWDDVACQVGWLATRLSQMVPARG